MTITDKFYRLLAGNHTRTFRVGTVEANVGLLLDSGFELALTVSAESMTLCEMGVVLHFGNHDGRNAYDHGDTGLD